MGDLLPIDRAIGLVSRISKEAGITQKEEKAFDLIIKACPVVSTTQGDYIRMGDLRGFISNFTKAIASNDSSFLAQKRGIWVDRVVDIIEFAESPVYMNQKGYLRPAIKEKLWEFFNNEGYVEGVLTGAIGIGKNYFADIAMAYVLYKLSCFHNPQLEHDLAPGSSIVFIMQSLTLTLAKKVVFDQFSERLKRSPFFTNHFSFDPDVKSELRFPKNIYVLPLGGSDTSALGMNVFGGVIDELNFMARTKDSVHTLHTGEEEYNQAERLYRTIIRRMKSRFMQKGKLPGKLMLVSSSNYPNDFTSNKIEESKTDSTIFVMKMSQWEALPEDRFCGERFLVEVGNEFKQSRIIESREDAFEVKDVVEVPIEYKSEFERNIEEALRDLGGIATGTKHPFIPFRELLVKSHQSYNEMTNNRTLFTLQEIDISMIIDDPDHPDWELLVNQEYIDECVLDARQVFACHIDVGLTHDAAGLAIGRIIGYKLLPSTKYFNEKSGEFIEVNDIRAPMYQIDGVIRFVASPGNEVDLNLVRDLVLYLRGVMNVRWASMDSYQSAMMIQAFRKSRMRSGVLSMDTSIAPYTEVKLSIKDERIFMPEHVVLMRELRELERVEEKVDHPQGGSKDCSDAVAGVVYMLQRKEASYGRPVSRRRRGVGSEPDMKETQQDGSRVRKVRMGQSRRRLGRII